MSPSGAIGVWLLREGVKRRWGLRQAVPREPGRSRWEGANVRADGGAGADKRSGFRNKTTIAVLSGSLAVLPVLAVSDATVRWLDVPEQEQAAPAPWAGGQPPASVSVNGSLPEAPPVEKLWAPVEPVTGSLGIPSTALEAYKRAAE